MKYTSAFLLIALAPFVTPINAQAGGLSMSLSLDRIQSSLDYKVSTGENLQRKDSDLGGRVEAAYTFDINKSIGLAVGADVGISKTRVIKEDADFSNVYRKAGDYRFFLQPEIKLTDRTTATARVGFAKGRFGSTGETGTIDGRLYGIGIRTDVSKSTSVFLNYERTVYKDDMDGDKVRLQADATRAGIQYRF